ncbi:MAG: hypothetical protein HYV51_00585 [Parcubacteria group bacterium]|nr:hypothetical protein [Parcubacteria group bacterium]
MIKKISLVVFLLSLLLITPNFSFGATSAEIQTQIQVIMAQIQALQQKLAQLQSQQGDDRLWCHTFNANLMIGNTGDEVSALQTALQKEGFSISSDEMAKSGGTPGVAYSVPANFGESTASAVTGFQEKYRNEILTPLGLKYGTGYVGKSTRAKLNKLYGCGVVMPIPTEKPKPISAGYLDIEPSAASIAVGGSVSMQAFYQPPMPKCPEGFACPQVMPARIPVVAEWTSSNPGVASIIGVAVGDCFTERCRSFYSAEVKGISSGTADIKASYKSPSGTILTATAKVTIDSVSLVPSITVLSPNGEESIFLGQSNRINWSLSGDTNQVRYIALWLLRKDQQVGWVTPKFGGISSTADSYVWDGYYTDSASQTRKTPDIGNGYKIEVIAYGKFDKEIARDQSDAPFSIVASVASTNTAPKIIGIPAIPSSLQPGQSVLFFWNATDADKDNLSWSVNWGDGTGSAGACPVSASNLTIGTNSGTNFMAFHNWSKAGTYKVQASVSDCNGGSDMNTFNVTVSGASGTNVQYPINQ